MIPPWVASYLQVPFRDKGRTRDGVDCYGLVRLIYHEQRRIELPSYTEAYATSADQKEITALLSNELGSQWREIPWQEAGLFDGLVLRIAGQPTHFGMVLDPPWFIHAIKRIGQQTGKTWIERWDSLAWQRRLLAAVRWQEIG